jgi:hypothetical protein
MEIAIYKSFGEYVGTIRTSDGRLSRIAEVFWGQGVSRHQLSFLKGIKQKELTFTFAGEG